MKYIQLKALGLMLVGGAVFAACNDAEYSTLADQAYIAQTNTNSYAAKKITIGTTDETTDINVRLSHPTASDCNFEIVSDPQALKEYNEFNQTNYKELPAGSYTLSSAEAKVDAGNYISKPITLTIHPLSADLKATGSKYAVPLRLKSKDGAKEVLNSGSTIMYILDQVVITPVPKLNTTNRVGCTMRQENYELKEWTVEFCVNMDLLGTAIGSYNNQALCGIYPKTGSGKDGEIYIRFGDTSIEGNRLQIKTQGTQMNSKTLFNTNTWYHIAFVCTTNKLYLYVNGVLDNSIDTPGKIVNVGSNGLNLCASSMLHSNVYMSEFRLWTKSRTQSEIANNMYSIEPDTDGLEVYWKMNEGTGNEFADKTGHNNKGIVAGGAPTWKPNVRIDGK